MRKLALTSAILLIATTCLADRLVLTPRGKKILNQQVRIEYLNEASREQGYIWLGYGVNDLVELELVSDYFADFELSPSLNASYNIVPPVTDIAPGISVGMLDTLNRTELGRAAYFAITFRLGNWDELNQDVPTEFTLGFWDRDAGVVFGSVSLPISTQLSLIAEHDSTNLTAGFQVSPDPDLDLRVLFRKSQVMLGLRFQLGR